MQVRRPFLRDLTKFAGWAVVSVLIFLALGAVAHAHPQYRSHHAHAVVRHVAHDQAGSLWDRLGFGSAGVGGNSSLVAAARSQVGNGAVYGRATLWCARFVNYVLKVAGYSGTGSDAAFSFAHYGHRVSGPVPGAIAVMGRRGGGHVGIVSGVDANGNPILISGNNAGRVREAPYPRGRILTYVVP